MGAYTRFRLETFAEQAGIRPAEGDRAAKLARLQQTALDLIRLLELERSGIRDGDGGWHGCDPLSHTVESIADQWRAIDGNGPDAAA